MKNKIIIAIVAIMAVALSGAAHAQDGVAYSDGSAWSVEPVTGSAYSAGSYASGGYSGGYAASAYYSGGRAGAFYSGYYGPGYSAYPYYSYYAFSRSYFPSAGYYPNTYYGYPYGYNSVAFNYPGYAAPTAPAPGYYAYGAARYPSVASSVSGLAHVTGDTRPVGSASAHVVSAPPASTGSYSGNKAAWY